MTKTKTMLLKSKRLSAVFLRNIFLLFAGLFLYLPLLAQPVNDNCGNASTVSISNSGFGVGTFASATVDISDATVQNGETFAPAILVAGQSQKSVWYKFTIPTTRSVRVTLAQSGTAITAGDVGFAVYKTSSCLPSNAGISTKLTPIALFGNTFHPCVDSGEYFVQVSSKSSARGQILIQVETALPTAVYDQPKQASDFSTLKQGIITQTFDVDCQSIEDATEVCTGLDNGKEYIKSTWHVFQTPAYFDYIVLMLALQSTPNSKIGVNIYEGDVRAASFKTLPMVVQCDSFVTNGGYYSRKHFTCDKLQVNKTYSVQLFFHQSFADKIKLSMALGGAAPTQAPVPVLSGIPSPTNSLGTLPSNAYGYTTTARDQFGCNSRHSVTSCLPAIPKEGFLYAPYNHRYNLSTFFTFNLSSATTLNFYISEKECGGNVYVRLFNQAPTNNCNDLDTAKIIAEGPGSFTSTCLPAGSYTLQVMGRDTTNPEYWYAFGGFPDGYSSYSYCLQENLGSRFAVNFSVKDLNPGNRYSLARPGAFDSINVVNGTMKPLVESVTYTSVADTIGCLNTVLPADTTCYPGNTKGVYRQMEVGERGMLSLQPGYYWGKLYQGDANALATAQKAFNYPDRITGLKPYTECVYHNSCDGAKVCVEPGTYTYVSFAGEDKLSSIIQPSFSFSSNSTKYASLATAEDLGNVTGNKTSNVDIFGCKDNAIAIGGLEPLNVYNKPATKAIYRQFYLANDSRIAISGYHYLNCGYTHTGNMRLFYGKATDGASGLRPVGGIYDSFVSTSPGQCDVLPAGWYTVVSYGSGPTFEEPMRDLNQWGYGSYVGVQNQVTVSLLPTCPSPKYNRPAKAAIDTLTNKPFLLQWGPRVGHTVTYPKTDTTITLYTENFNCNVDTPFTVHPVPSCDPSLVKVAYYVFQTTQEAYVQINTESYWAAVYTGNARNGTTKFDSTTLIQPCIYGQPGKIQLNRLQPGTYTLVVFATESQNCHSVRPTLYIDRMGYSRFDHARNAYDFGVVPPDSLWHNGKVGDINPLNKDRAPSDDFIYSTTGAQDSDPADHSCYSQVKPEIYNTQNNVPLFKGYVYYGNEIPRRNLWYTFVVKEGGTVRVKVNNRTIDRGYPYRFSIYKSDVDASLPFSEVVASGAVDSTKQQGLSFVTGNHLTAYWNCYTISPEMSFYRDPCSPRPERYYVVVENNFDHADQGMKPNSELDISILVDSVYAIKPKFDHYSSAGNIGANLGPGRYKGEEDNFSCATSSPTDPTLSNYSCAPKTLWYKFSTSVTGHVRFRMAYYNKQSTNFTYTWTDIQLYRQIRQNDSTTRGLQLLNMSGTWAIVDNAYWGEQCITPGTYYFVLPGCNMLDQNTYPEIEVVEEAGDFCSAPMVVGLNGAGAKTISATIDCHTIGTDYGEFNPTLSCPDGALKGDYKTTWYRIDITGKDTLDVTTFLTENTTALPSEIKYRMMEGTCGAMQERSCVQDAQTQDTYKCLPPGSYYIQVFTPVLRFGQQVTGNIVLNLSAVKHVDTCAPLKTCLSTAVFIPQYDCTKSDEVTFTNLSTYGTNIDYKWDFGWNGQTSTAVSPGIVYPVLDVDKTYTIKLKVTNNNCPAGSQNTDETTTQITIPGRPKLNLGNDTVNCTYGSSLKLNAETWNGTTYKWSTGETTPSIIFNSVGYPYDVWVEASYKGCIKRDTINVSINPINPKKESAHLCGNDSVQLYAHRGYNETHLWNTGSTANYIYAKTGGIYVDEMTWRGCTINDSFTVVKATSPFPKEDTTICPPFRSFKLNAAAPGAYAYSWQDGSGGGEYTVSAPGTYWVQTYYPNCSFRDTLVVKQSPATIRHVKDTILCEGQSYLTSWGQLLTQSGTYRDTVRYDQGCDSLVSTVNLKVVSLETITSEASICAGSTYILPWGKVVNSGGIYRDTLRTRAGCDSLLRIVNLQVNRPSVTTADATICQGQSYQLPWGRVVGASGIYRDTLRHIAGCDSVIRVVNLKVNSVFTEFTEAGVCEGGTYRLPWGEQVSAGGTYRDVIRYASGCDSLIREVTLRVTARTVQNTVASICEGGSYTLPWGAVVNTAGLYRDTARTTLGCDSLIRSVDLAINSVSRSSQTITLCQGQSYTLPSGEAVSSSGTFLDTLRSVNGGCDSVIRTILVRIQTLSVFTINETICDGNTFTLPWGGVAGTAGIYRDTLHYTTGCDSIIRVVNLKVNAPSSTTVTASVCEGQTYKLPWGTIVNESGIYRDTLRYETGCDSLIRKVSLTIKLVLRDTTLAVICSGDRYPLPWGGLATTTGVYRDTLLYASGCDSLIRIVDLAVKTVTVQSTKATICKGQSYTLPWGIVVSQPGTYLDTLRYENGCDSVRRTVTVNVQETRIQNSTAVICSGDFYTLPWGATVDKEGIYRDTLRYTSGCDSIARIINLVVQTPTIQTSMVSACEGQLYRLPWGQIATRSGTYRDTLHYSTGCDSVVRVVNLTVQQTSIRSSSITICSGHSYTLPWGSVVSTTGTYRDTLYYRSGCDSVIQEINLMVSNAAMHTVNASICSDQTYTLPWGQMVNTAGIYRDTLRTALGCDSLVRVVTLKVNKAPSITLTKSNDITCMLGTARLTATGGSQYQWSPSASLDNAMLNSPVASPTATTTYQVQVTTAEGCVGRDSLVVNVNTSDADGGYLVPSAFTPNNDGKNDCFGVKHWGAVTDFHFAIYDRWGKLIFETQQPSACWDGTLIGQPLQTDVFIYLISAKTMCGPVLRKGTVTIIR